MSGYRTDNSFYGGWGQRTCRRRSERRRAPRERTDAGDWDAAVFAESSSEEDSGDGWEGLLRPGIDQILAAEDSRFLVKRKGRSYRHLEWHSEAEILQEGHQAKLKLNRFRRDKLPLQSSPPYFDPAYLEVDRILATTEVFPVVHPLQASALSDLWQASCVHVMSKLMNFYRNGTPYALPFLHIEEDCDEYPIDFTTAHNRLYNGYYAHSSEFWKDLGFVFKNAQRSFVDPAAEVRVACDTLRDLAIALYKHWQPNSGENYTLRWITELKAVDVFSTEFLQASLYEPPFTQEEEDADFTKNQHPLSPQEIKAIVDEPEVDKLFFVKWRNLSYVDTTWECESLIKASAKVGDFYRFSRAVDPTLRQAMTDLNQNYSKAVSLTGTDSRQLRQCLRHIDFPTFNFEGCENITPNPVFREGKALKDYQLVGLRWLLQNWLEGRNSILADEMGLGKTVQIISFLNTQVQQLKQRGPYLVVAPLSTLSHWKKVIEEWTFMNGIIYHDTGGNEGRSQCREFETYYTDITKKGRVSSKSKLVKFNVVVTTFEVFMQDYSKFFLDIPFQLVVIDEAHRLKNKQAKILTYFTELPVRRFILMTGTPLQNNTEELWSLLHFIEPNTFSDLDLFLESYGSLETQEQVSTLQQDIRPYLLRRLKEEVETSIPPLQETVVDVELTTLQKTYYRAIYERNRTFLCKGGQVPQLANLEMQLRKCCNHPYLIRGVEQSLLRAGGDVRAQQLVASSGKMVLLDKLMPKLKAAGKKVLIFSQFTQMLNILEEYLQATGYRFERLDGTIKAAERHASIERFNNEELDVFLLSTRAGGLGINLATAQVVIIFDSDWNPQNDVQATARAHRIGQTEEVQVYRLVTARTYEAQMFARASRKLGLDQAVFLARENRGEIESLLKFGAYSLWEDDAAESKTFVESDIDEILSARARVINYGKGNYSLSKSSFVACGSDTSINIDDPQFWSKVLPAQSSLASRLLTKLNDKQFSDEQQQAEFMQELELAVNEALEAQDLEEKDLLTSLLFQVSQDKEFVKENRKLANRWINDMTRPLRRKKAKDSPKYLSESDEPAQKLTSFYGTGLLCSHCEKEGCGYFCAGPCKRSFHANCRDKELDPNHDALVPVNEEPTALEHFGWVCEDCTQFQARCFKCGKVGPFLAHSPDSQQREPVVKCSLNTCGKFFHLACLESTPGKRFMCPWHHCSICKNTGASKSLIQCVRCPNAFHIRCYHRKAARLNKRFLICHAHKQPSKVTQYDNQKNKLAEVVKVLKEKIKEAATKHAHLSLTEKKNDPTEVYNTHGLIPPDLEDYPALREPWCRYCGARRAPSFAKGPWGPDTLCSTHFAAWKHKKKLDLSAYSDKPTLPINPEKNTEINFLTKNSRN